MTITAPKRGELTKVHLPLDPPIEGCAGESLWCECVRVHRDGTWTGRLDNHPVFSHVHGYLAHDIVHFAWKAAPEYGEDAGNWEPARAKRH